MVSAGALNRAQGCQLLFLKSHWGYANEIRDLLQCQVLRFEYRSTRPNSCGLQGSLSMTMVYILSYPLMSKA